MAYNIIIENPLKLIQFSDFVVDYSEKQELFLVKSTSTGKVAYRVNRKDVVGDCFKYSSEIEAKILEHLPEGSTDVTVMFTNAAHLAVALTQEGNRLLF